MSLPRCHLCCTCPCTALPTICPPLLTACLSASPPAPAVPRYGPHQGSYMFHCHNLEHEDIGLMAAFNSTSTTHPRIDTKFDPSAY